MILEQSVISIPNDLRYLSPLQGFAKEVLKQVGFDSKDTEMTLLCLEEAVTNVIEHAFDPGEKDFFQVIIKPLASGIRIIVKDKGLPYDPSLIPDFKIYPGLDEQTDSGLGVYLMKNIMDEVSFHNLGREGKELHLTKYLPAKNITEYHTHEELSPFIQKPLEIIRQEEDSIMEIRLMKPSEAIDASRIFYRAYGYTYSIDEIYYPERFKRLIEEGKIISIVGLNSKGDIVSHTGIKRESADAVIGEAGMAATTPDFRGKGSFTRMLDYLNNMAKKQGMKGLYGRGTTFHPFSQKAGNTCGYRDCAITLCSLPSDRVYKGMGNTTDRPGTVYAYLSLTEHAKATIYPPEHHRGFIKDIYNNLNIQVEIVESCSSGEIGLQDQSNFKVDYLPYFNRADIKLYTYGKDVIDRLAETMKMLLKRKVDVVNLFLDLEDPATVQLCERIERLGFFIAGAMPLLYFNHTLILQYLNNISPDYSKIQVFSDFGRYMLDYIKERDPNR